MKRIVISNLLGLVGAALGGVLGYYTFGWLEYHHFYGLAIPGAFLGLGCGLLAQHHSRWRGAFCGIAALGLSLFTEWQHHFFLEDSSFTFMLTHLGDKSPVTWIMMAIATVVAYWVGQDAGIRLLSRGRPDSPVEAKSPKLQEDDG